MRLCMSAGILVMVHSMTCLADAEVFARKILPANVW
jgi:hypothetical protein